MGPYLVVTQPQSQGGLQIPFILVVFLRL